MAARGDIELGRAFVRLFVKDDLSKTIGKAVSAANQAMSKLGEGLMSGGTKALGAGLAIAAPLAMSLKTFASFDDAMAAVGAVSNASAEQLAAMTAQAMELGRTTSYTAAQIAGLQTELGRAGFKPDEIIAATGAIQNLGRATNTDLAKAAEIAGAALRQFNLPASDAVRVADVLTATANNSAQTVLDLGEAFSYVGPVATDAGLSIEETSTALGVLANLGLKGSMGGTGLRRALLAFADPNSQKQIEALGVKATDAAGNLRPLSDVMIELGRATADMPNAERLAFFQKAFDLRGMTAGMKLSSSPKEMEAMAAAIAKAGGAAERTAKKMDDTLGGTWRRFMSAVEGVQIAVGLSLAQTFRAMDDTVTGLLGGFSTWIGKNPEIIRQIGMVAAGLIAGGTAAVTLGAALVTLSTAFAGIGGAVATMVAIAPAILPLAAAVAGIAAGLGSLYLLDSAGILDFGAVLAALKDTGSYLGGEFLSLWGTVSDAAKTAWGGISAAIAQGDFQTAGEIAMAGLEVAMLAGSLAIQTIWEDLRTAMNETWEGLWIGMGGIATRSMKVMADMLTKLITSLGPIGATLKPIVENVSRIGLDKMSETFESQIGAGLSDAEIEKRKRLAEAQRKLADAQAKLNGLSDSANSPQQWIQQSQEIERWEQVPQTAESRAKWEAEQEAKRQEAAGAAYAEGMTLEPQPVEMSEEDRKSIFEPAGIVPTSSLGPTIGPTFSAAAAQAAGQMGGADTVAGKQLSYLEQMTKAFHELNALTRDQTVTFLDMKAQYAQYVAAVGAYG